MEKESLFDELDALYKEEKLADSTNVIIKDGTICKEDYERQETKVLFIAKEHNLLNDKYKDGDYRVW